MKRRLSLCLVWAVVALSSARAQELPDPTRPPPEAGQAAGSADADLPKASLLPQLQSVLIGTHGREVAVIDGQTVRKGEKFNGAVLVKVSKDRVVLRRGGKDQVLTLFPAPDQDKTKK
jgi:MSHA biogenesis protein MshK